MLTALDSRVSDANAEALGVSVILFMTFVLRDLYAIVGGYIVVAVLSTFINASPNREVIGYRYSEQVRDICPAFLLAALAAAAAWGVSALGLGELPQIALQVVVMAVVYLGAARLLRVEEFEYLLSTARGVLGRGRR